MVDPEEVEWEWMVSSGTVDPAEGMGENTPTVSVGTTDVQVMVTATYLGCPAMGDTTISPFIGSVAIPTTSTSVFGHT